MFFKDLYYVKYQKITKNVLLSIYNYLFIDKKQFLYIIILSALFVNFTCCSLRFYKLCSNFSKLLNLFLKNVLSSSKSNWNLKFFSCNVELALISIALISKLKENLPSYFISWILILYIFLDSSSIKHTECIHDTNMSCSKLAISYICTALTQYSEFSCFSLGKLENKI